MKHVEAGFEKNECFPQVGEGLAGRPLHSPIPKPRAQERNRMTQCTAIVADSDIDELGFHQAARYSAEWLIASTQQVVLPDRRKV
jgi:hypothetical protein